MPRIGQQCRHIRLQFHHKKRPLETRGHLATVSHLSTRREPCRRIWHLPKRRCNRHATGALRCGVAGLHRASPSTLRNESALFDLGAIIAWKRDRCKRGAMAVGKG